MPGAGLSRESPRKAPLGKPAFQPYWGKPAVRNDRGDRGNVGIIRSPIRASILPDSHYQTPPHSALAASPQAPRVCTLSMSRFVRSTVVPAVVGIIERVGEPLLVAPCPLAVFQPRIDLTRLIVSEIDYRNQASTSFQKFDVTLRCQVLIDINLLGLLSANINILEPVNIEHAFDVQDTHFSVATKCHCPWSVTFRDAIVEKLVVDALSGNERPDEKQFRHARVGFDIMSQKILNCLVPADFQSSLPSTFYGQFWRCNHKKHIN